MIPAAHPVRYVSLLLLTLVACSSGDEGTPSATQAPHPLAGHWLTGHWRGVLTSPGGELPFGLEISEDAEGLHAAMLNGEERAPFSSVKVDGNLVVLEAEWYDSVDHGRARRRHRNAPRLLAANIGRRLAIAAALRSDLG